MQQRRGALPGIEARRQQPRQAGLRPVFGQAEHLTVHEVRQHRVELLRLAAVNLVRAQVPGRTAGTVGVPLAQERVLCAPESYRERRRPNSLNQATSAC